MKELVRDRDTRNARGKPRVQTINDEPSMTVQSDAHLSDIQNILRQYEVGGLQRLDETALMFKDVSEFTDLQDAMNQAIVAKVEFMKLPSKAREIFHHDVAVWLDTAHDKDKRDALVEAGFIEGPKEKEVVVGETGPTRAPGKKTQEGKAASGPEEETG